MLKTIINWLSGLFVPTRRIETTEKEKIVVDRNTIYNTMVCVDESVDTGKRSLTLTYGDNKLYVILDVANGGTEFSVPMSSGDAAMFINVMELNRSYSLPKSYVTPFVNGLLNTLRERGLIMITTGHYDTTIWMVDGVTLNIVR